MTDDIEARLRDADPMDADDRRREPTTSWIPALVAATVGVPPNDPRPLARRRWVVAGVTAAASVSIALAGYSVLTGGEDSSPPAARATTLRLSLPAPGTSSQSCLAFSTEILAGMPLAFSGTAVEVGDGSVMIEVDHWYRGGNDDQVRLDASSGDTVSLDGAVTFETGHRYLVTATGGVVNSCGFTSAWTDKMAAAFDEAFGG
jgi:hypothetical protein